MKMLSLLLSSVAVLPCQALLRATEKSHITSLATAFEAESQAQYLEVQSLEAEANRFWTAEWTSLEEELKQLAAVVGEAPLIPAHLNLNPKSAAELAPALAMLKGLYEDGKTRIGKLNEREKSNEEKFKAKEVEHAERMARIDGSFKNHSLSTEFHDNETRDENRLYKYWERVHQRQHKQYHTGLKIQHATLDKVKKMIDMYEKTMSGTADASQVKKMLKKVAPPEIVFLQSQTLTEVRSFCKSALLELKGAHTETSGD